MAHDACEAGDASASLSQSRIANSESSLFSHPIRVYWEDTDAGGVVYHASYVRFLERARSEWLRSLGIGQQTLREQQGVVFAVRGMQLDFLAPARLDDALSVLVGVSSLGRASLVFEQRIVRDADARVLLTATVKVACLSAPDFRPRPLPDGMRERFKQISHEV
ncbi:MAG: tol-pal system-associated acyl-CoA thioesterase [Lysobacteraceae bacterium]|nr:tol-pal system-associated acyl-CoA thioesterase [Gammaproteobacteria bacterium]